MKKIAVFLIAVALLLLTGCSMGTQPNDTNAPFDKIEQSTQEENKEISKMFITVNGNKLEVTLTQNSSTDALAALLKQGDITFTAIENGGFEIYGSIGHSLPTNNTRITAKPGDVLLYAGHNLCFFFGENTYSYTRIGKINATSELYNLLSADSGTVQVTISLK